MLSESELERERAHVVERAAQILDLENSIAELRAEQLEIDVPRATRFLYKYPLLTLPNEITSEIFIHSLPLYPICPPLFGILSPTSLTQICRRWRAIALATPALWRAIEFSAYSPRLPTYDAWLGLSGSFPLSIRVDESGKMAHLPEVLTAIVPHCERLEHLKNS
ncbi:hypothetical protein DFH08DRAFT_888911 [Mycena albidolilacea]|uniref:F-box domain-containing protein n=1 Tax=Mycena albidolilacea TaxID=1033008 RepID=A0AAD6ZHN3_9AGAR|nr:hypothetical protein DFH08DRAFT_888911 [Mycena albidolilacea]